MSEEARWLLATGIVIASFVLLVVSFKLFTIPPRQLRLVEERHGQEITEATQKISELTDALEGARRTMLATPDQLLDSHLRNLQIRIADLVREDFVIRGRVIEDCYLYGPAMITLKPDALTAVELCWCGCGEEIPTRRLTRAAPIPGIFWAERDM